MFLFLSLQDEAGENKANGSTEVSFKRDNTGGGQR